MTQYPNEKDPHSSWVPPPATQGPYTARDGAPGNASSSHAPQGSSQGYFQPPDGPPPDYGYVQAHPSGGASSQLYPAAAPYNTPDAGPSSLQYPNRNADPSGGMSLGSFFGNKGPPPMWHRQPPPMGNPPYTYNAFPPMCLISNNNDLSNGFPELPPPCQLNPHPFAMHDVTEEDWKWFLGDIKKAGSLSPAQRIRSNIIPMMTGMSLLAGMFTTRAIGRNMKFKNRHAAGDLVDHWNHYFFGPRRMEVVLCQASERLSGRAGAAPVGDPNQTRMAQGLRQRIDDSSSDDSDSEDVRRGHNYGHGQNYGHSDRHTRRQARRERRADRRERRAERRNRKARGEFNVPYELFITAI